MKHKAYAIVIGILFILSSFTMKSRFLNVRQVEAENWVEAKAECVMEANSRRILYAAHGDTRLPMASTTKILTAITVLNACVDISEELIVPEQAVGVEGSSVYLKSGEKYSVRDLLYGLMLRSGNDCATALAWKIGGNVVNFSAMMNIMAQKAGAFQSNFVNPHGLPAKNHYTTAIDLCLITAYAMQNSVFREIVSTKYYAPQNWKNKNKMLTSVSGAIGVKTGYTKEAGRCLVSAIEREGMTLICTVLGCPTTYERSIKLLEDAFGCYKNTQLVSKDVPLRVGSTQGYADRDLFYPLSEGEESQIELRTFPVKDKQNKKIIGQFEIYLSKRLLFSGNLYKL